MTPVPFRQDRDRLVLHLLDARDTPWIAALLDEVEHAVGRPWRELLERIERLPARTAPARRAAVVQAIRASLGGQVSGGLSPRRVRRALLGAAAVDAGARAARIAAVAQALDATEAEVLAQLWRDLPGERAVVLPAGRPAELTIAAEANLRIIQRALTRCYELRLEVSGNARAVARTAALRGLLAVARRDGERVVLHVSGPLALFHRTVVYGRAMGSLVPQLAWCEQFRLEARCDLGQGPATCRIQAPVLLPPAARPRRHDSALEARFERDMAARAPSWRVLREPSPVDAGPHLVFPDFQLEHRVVPGRRWWVELVGYWTADYLAHKLATYRAANLAHVILCIDASRALDHDELPRGARVVRFNRRVPVDEVLAIIDG